DALDKILNTPLHTFRYIKEVEGYGTDSPLAKTRLGYIADEVDPIFMVGNVIDQVSVNGILIASIKALNLKLNDINNLEKENSWRDALVGWFGNMANGIGDFFANRIRTKTICLGEEGNETCITKSQLDQMLNNINSSQTIIINNGGSSNTTEENTDENITENITEDIDTSTDTENTTEDTDTSIDTEDVVSETIDEADNIDPEDTSDQIEESNTSVEVNIDTSTDTETIVDTTSELY
ncbi:MAG: tail fiber domain-containing protein, partial [Candidatus Pacebacteria bacterium]|nr:tail fiber domain-containing protein [Candidatus Paceibacterota bacterium]